MKKIEYEISRLLSMAADGELPGYPAESDTPCADMAEYFSGENNALERQLEALWANDARMRRCIPIILAAVEKSRSQEANAVPRTELYNYTM